MKALLAAATVILAASAALPSPLTREARLERAWQTSIRPSEPGRVEAVGIVRLDDVLIVEDDRKGLTALRLADGLPRWSLTLDRSLDHAPTEHDGLITLVAGNHLQVVSKDAGFRVFESARALAPSGAPVAHGRGVFVPSYAADGLVALSMDTGLDAWSMRLPGDVIGPALVTPAEQVVVALTDGTLRAMQARLTTPRRELWVARVGEILGRVVLEESSLVFSTRAAHVQRRDANSGALTWTVRPGRPVTTPPVASAQHDVVIVGIAGALHAASFADGTERWQTEGAEWPVGLVEPGAVLVRRPDGTSALRDVATGDVLIEKLSSNLLPCGAVLVEWGNDQKVHAHRLTR